MQIQFDAKLLSENYFRKQNNQQNSKIKILIAKLIDFKHMCFSQAQNRLRNNKSQLQRRIVTRKLPSDFFNRKERESVLRDQLHTCPQQPMFFAGNQENLFLFTFRQSYKFNNKTRTADTDVQKRIKMGALFKNNNRQRSQKSLKLPSLTKQNTPQKKINSLENNKIFRLNLKDNSSIKPKINKILRL